MSLLQQFTGHIQSLNLFTTKDKLLIAVSGGVDSVVLCELCKQAGYDFMIAHCNFQLRGEESERDENFVRLLAKKYATGIAVERFDTAVYASQHKLSIQEAARELRYRWFEKLLIPDAGFSNLNFVLTAHHADDNAETLLMNFFRGTGLHGLTGIPAAISYIRRPLLSFSKQALIAFAREYKLEYVEDSSNQLSKYTRNFFRNELLPAISEVYPQVRENLQDNISRFKEIETLYALSVGQIKTRLLKVKNGEVHVPVKQLMNFNNRALIYEIIKDFDFTEKQVDEVIKLAKSESGKYIESPVHSFRIIRHRHWLIIAPVHSLSSSTLVIDETTRLVEFEAGHLQVEMVQPPVSLTTKPAIAYIDYHAVEFPLILRKWKTGDYFYPLGMKKKKKLSRFFIDQKFSTLQKEKTWVIESNKRITWIVGQRLDDRFRITTSTKKVLQVTFISHP